MILRICLFLEKEQAWHTHTHTHTKLLEIYTYMSIDILPERSKRGPITSLYHKEQWEEHQITKNKEMEGSVSSSLCCHIKQHVFTGLSRCDGTIWLMWLTVRSSCRKLTLPCHAPDQCGVIASTHKQTLTPSRPHLPVTHLTWARSLSWPHTHAQCQAGDHSDIPNIPWCSSSPQLFWPVFVQLSVRTLLKQLYTACCRAG